VTIGVDIGQRVDPTAIAVVEREQRIDQRRDGTEWRVWHHTVRHLERLPLGTPYPAVAERLKIVAARVANRTGGWPHLYLDATGVGTPVVDVLKDHKVQARLTAVYFTYGDRRLEGDDGSIILGKAYLVSRLQALFQDVRLHLPPGHPEAETMTRELLDYEIRVDQNANDKYGAFRVGTHDDLVTALGLATQTDGNLFAEALAAAMQPARRDRRSRPEVRNGSPEHLPVGQDAAFQRRLRGYGVSIDWR
jgi:hypothetical protein